ncbi:MAG: ATP-grasp domain-containing protein, partial [Candidatus Eisenbacteria bacterium]
MADERVLVVGTTPDYVELILTRYPGRAVFLTDRRFRAAAHEAPPPPADEWVDDLSRPPSQLLISLRRHLNHRGIDVAGIACFDCESLRLAADLAQTMRLPYPAPAAIALGRDKYASKRLWHARGLPCPKAELVRDDGEAFRFLRDCGAAGIVLKPLSGSGSEFVFLCRTATEIRTALSIMREGLARHHDVRMYAALDTAYGHLDPREVFVAEQFIAGDEYSCDFLIDRGEVEIIRIARKLLAPRAADGRAGAATIGAAGGPATTATNAGARVAATIPAGTTIAYRLPARLPRGISRVAFRRQIAAAARSLGFDRAIIMLDFIVHDGRAMMIEMSPRPGGDCLPPLILESCGFDMLGAALDFSAGRSLAIPPRSRWERRVGLRLLAVTAGTVAHLDASRLRADPRVHTVHLTRSIGHPVALPPENYDSRILGYAIFAPSAGRGWEKECRDLNGLLDLRITPAGAAAR